MQGSDTHGADHRELFSRQGWKRRLVLWGGAVGVALMSALLLALLQDSSFAHLASSSLMSEGHSGNVLLDGLNAAPGDAQNALRAELSVTFRHLLWVSTAVSLLGLAAAIAMPNNLLRGREHGAK